MPISDNKYLLKKVEKSIILLYQEFNRNPHIFIREKDIQCYLYMLINKCLGKKSFIKLAYEDIDNKKKYRWKAKTCRVHAEFPLLFKKKIRHKKKKDRYKTKGVLDLVVLSQKSVLDSYEVKDVKIPIPYDVFFGDYQSIGIEIKINRNPTRDINKVFRRIEQDVVKSYRLNLFETIMVYIDKYGRMNEKAKNKLKTLSKNKKRAIIYYVNANLTEKNYPSSFRVKKGKIKKLE